MKGLKCPNTWKILIDLILQLALCHPDPVSLNRQRLTKSFIFAVEKEKKKMFLISSQVQRERN